MLGWIKRLFGVDGDAIVGHKTFLADDGSGFRRAPLTKREGDALWKQARREQRKRARAMPDEKAAIRAMQDAFERLKELGWREAIYCPKDGTSFEVIEPGSTGIFPCHYDGEWPDGSWWIEEDGGCPSRPVLFRLYPEDEAKRKAKMEAASARYHSECEAEQVVSI